MKRLLIILVCGFLSLGVASQDFEEDHGNDYYTGDAEVFDMTSGTTDQSFCIYLNVEGFDSDITAFKDAVVNFTVTSGDAWGFNVGNDTGVSGNNAVLWTAGANSGSIDMGSSTGVWEYYCAIFEQSNDNIFVYLDNVEKHSDTSYTDDSGGSGTDIWVGRDSAGNNEYDGLIAYLDVVNRVLQNYERQELRFKPSSIDVDGSWNIVDSTTSHDISGNDNDLTENNTDESSDGPPVMFGGGLPL